MKKTIGWILLVICGLNLISLFARMSKGDSPGSPMYIILLVMMVIGALVLIGSKKDVKPGDNNLPEKREDD